MRVLYIIVFILSAAVALAQNKEQTLADVRQDLTILYIEMLKLKRELSTTGAASPQVITSGSSLARLEAIEIELQRLIAQTEELQYQVDRVVRDGTSRIENLEFRLVELEGGDVSNISETTTLGTLVELEGAIESSIDKVTSEPELAVGEKADFDAASDALANGEYELATDLFQRFSNTYPDSPLNAKALLSRGIAFEELGELKSAARAFLNSYTDFPESGVAPEVMFRLGQTLVDLGQIDAGCQILSQVQIRFPESQETVLALDAMNDLQCQ